MQVEFGRRSLTSAGLSACPVAMVKAEPVAGPWLRVYPQYVEGVFVDADGPEAEHRVEVRGTAVVMSGPVTGIELRVLEGTIDSNPAVTPVVLKNSAGGDARTGYAVGEFIRERGLNTALSAHRISSCSRAFLGGRERRLSGDRPLEKTSVGFHSNYAGNGA